MISVLKRYLAIRSYAKRLPNDLNRRFGLKNFYTIDNVTKAAERGGFNTTYIAYAHSIFCDQESFEAHYGSGQVHYVYMDLRSNMTRRFFRHIIPNFNAATIIRTSRMESADFHESGCGMINGG